MIPKKIFQTYKVEYNELSDNAKNLIQEWKDNNPDYEYFYYSDKDVEDFVLNEYGEEWHKRYMSLPYPVMKADVFRILVIYKYGGFYSDLDMKSLKPIDTLNRGRVQGLIGVLNYALLFHPFFGFSEKHPLMEYLVESLAQSIDNNKIEYFNDINYIVHQKQHINTIENRENFIVRYVQDVTGPFWWSESIMKYLKIENTKNLFDLYNRRISQEAKEELVKNKITIYLESFEKGGSPSYAIYKNLLGSENNFYGDGYKSWYGKY